MEMPDKIFAWETRDEGYRCWETVEESNGTEYVRADIADHLLLSLKAGNFSSDLQRRRCMG